MLVLKSSADVIAPEERVRVMRDFLSAWIDKHHRQVMRDHNLREDFFSTPRHEGSVLRGEILPKGAPIERPMRGIN